MGFLANLVRKQGYPAFAIFLFVLWILVQIILTNYPGVAVSPN
jgi:hypothetical protein